MMPRAILPGKAHPQGVTWDGTGANFSIYSEGATGVDLCLFDESGSEIRLVVPIRECTGHVWHCYVPGIKLGQLYGYRVYGPYDPERGQRFNPSKLLIDPYAKALSKGVDWNAPVFGYTPGSAKEDLAPNTEDDAHAVPKGVVTSGTFDWENDRPPMRPLHNTVIYEAHVKGLTAQAPSVPHEIRGTYAGLAYPTVIEYLKNLGITAVELMPVHAFLDDRILIGKGLKNYWGYNSINFFSPEARYSSSGDRGEQIGEFKGMVKALHRAGIEVILDAHSTTTPPKAINLGPR